MVVANLPSSNDPDSCIAMVKAVTRGSFKLRCKEPSNMDQIRQKNETVSWMVCTGGLALFTFLMGCFILLNEETEQRWCYTGIFDVFGVAFIWWMRRGGFWVC